MLRSSWRLFTVGGIEVGVHVSWLVIFGLVTWSLATGYFPTAYAESGGGDHLSTAAAWTLGVLAALLQQLPVVEDGTLVGTLARSDVIRQLQLRDALHPEA